MRNASSMLHKLTARFGEVVVERNCDTTCVLWFYQEKVSDKIRNMKCV